MALDGTRLSVSVVIPALSEGQNLVDTVQAVHENSGDPAPEIVVVDDGSADGAPERVAGLYAGDDRVRVIRGPGEGIARARNAGAAVARGEAIVFLDGHCYVPPGWLAPLVAPLADPQVAMTGPAFRSIRQPEVAACGVTWADPGLGNVWLPCGAAGPVPFHIGACQAVRADRFAEAGGFDPGMTRWGSEDIELCLRFWLLGLQVHGAPQSEVYHLFRAARPYSVDVMLILYNHVRLAALHLDGARLAQVLARMGDHPAAQGAIARAMSDGTLAERDRLAARRLRDAHWFFSRFGIGF